MNELSFFSQQSRMSDPGTFTTAFEDLPGAIAELVRVVQGLTIHVFWTERYGFSLPPERRAELQLRSQAKRLARTFELDSRPLLVNRPVEKKIVGNCRDFTLLLVSMLRWQGIPARARCGFAAYFEPIHYEDHWVAEYWNSVSNRWLMVDAQLDALHLDTLKISFDPLDVPRDQFIVGGKAWLRCRSGAADPATFGIFNMNGLGFIRGNLLRDLAALNKLELLPWDCWGLILKEQIDDPADLAVLDQVAALTEVDEPDFEAVRACYKTGNNLRVEGELVSFFNGEPIFENLSDW